MAMTKCKECGNEISKSASKCPKCGKSVTKPGILILGVICGLVVAFILYAKLVGF